MVVRQAQGGTESSPGAVPEMVIVVVPVHDEQGLLPHCMAALGRAAAAVSIPVHTIVVLDACTDDSADRVPGWARSIHVRARNVGAARAAGFDWAARMSANTSARDVWYATTDADSVVSEDWLTGHVHHARSADLVVGTVAVRWHEHGGPVRAEYERRYRHRGLANGHGHVHGANLGFRAAHYHAVGGFGPLAVGEDEDLVTRMREGGARTVWAEHPTVSTCDRRDNRVAGGFGGYLTDLAATVECA
ncbi:glycosyltransferase [Nocardia takedensis]|uniref:glycosyltransferase n=1 Tax=Nocardia takedensis TaxID=259390 RepID=UPI0006852B99|nr:glycosyltransferase [Nocardia takedensis]